MRISDFSFRSLLSRDLQSRQAAVAGAQRRVASGLRFQTAAEAPADSARLVRLDSQLGDIDAYRRSATTAGTRLAVEESVVRASRDLVQKAKDLTASVMNTNPGDPLRQAVDAEIAAIQDQLVALGNTRLGNEFVFAGGRTGTAPFLADGTYVGDSTPRRAALDESLTIDTTHTGDDLLGTTMAAVQAIRIQVQGGSGAQIQASLVGLNAASRDLLTREAEVGARQLAVQQASRSLAQRNAQLLGARESIASADPAESTVELVSAQNALERAYAAVGKVLGTSLIDFLR